MAMATRRLCCLLLILFCLFTGVVGTVNATTGSLNVDAGKVLTYKIDLNSQDRLELTFVTVAQASSNLSSSIVFPNSTVTNLGCVDKYSVSFTSDVTGTCELNFDNTNSRDSVIVALNYNVTHYVFGMPTTTFMLVFIVVLVMLAVGGCVMVSKYS
jgi:archaellin